VELEAARPSTVGEEELQLQLALAMSKEEHDEDEKKRKADEIKYQMAIEESKRANADDDQVCMSCVLIYFMGTCVLVYTCTCLHVCEYMCTYALEDLY
jgi:epsin